MLCKLGEVDFNVVGNERPDFFNEVTDRPVENIGNVTDHVENKPIILNIDGHVTGTDAGEKIAKLREYYFKKEIVKYIGRNAFSNVVIESLSTEHNNRVANGFTFNITLKEIKIAISERVELLTPTIKTQVKQVGNKGVQPKRQTTADEVKINEIRSKYADIEYGKLLN
jgi:hypothetical protein